MGPLGLIYAYLLYNCKNIPTAVMFYRVITLNLCKYIQALNLSGCQSFTKGEKKKKKKHTLRHKFSITDLEGIQLISGSQETELK